MPDPVEIPDPKRQISALQRLLHHLTAERASLYARLAHAEGDLRHLLRKFREEYHQHAERVAALLFALGVDARPEGDVGDAFRTALGRVFGRTGDAGELAGRGAVIIAEFDAAIRATPMNAHRARLEEMRDELADLVAEARGR